MGEPSYSAVIRNLARAYVPVRELGTGGKVAVTLAAGRVIAMAFSPNDQNLLWSHPQLSDIHVVRNHPETLKGIDRAIDALVKAKIEVPGVKVIKEKVAQ